MKKDCKNDSCDISKEDIAALSTKEKLVVMNLLLRMEEVENKMLREHITKLEKEKFPFRTKLRRVFRRN